MKRVTRKLIAGIAHHLGLWRPAYKLLPLVRGRYLLVVFNYHRIVHQPGAKKHYMPYERGMDKDVLDRQIEQIRHYFDIVNLDEFTRIVTGEKKPHRHSALLTFDDADAEFFETAFPVLTRQRCPAVVFAPTGFMGTDRKFWHVRVSEIVSNLTAANWEQFQAGADRLPPAFRELAAGPCPDSEGLKAALAWDLNCVLDSLSHDAIEGALTAWEAVIEKKQVVDIHCMGWEELRQLSQRDISVESHTVTHRKLAGLGETDITAELADSKSEIERRLGRAVTAVVYPQGSFNDGVLKAAAAAGYEVGFSTRPGVCRYPARGLDLYRLPRNGLDSQTEIDIGFDLGRIALRSLLAGRS